MLMKDTMIDSVRNYVLILITCLSADDLVPSVYSFYYTNIIFATAYPIMDIKKRKSWEIFEIIRTLKLEFE